jgi:hypothetical protein
LFEEKLGPSTVVQIELPLLDEEGKLVLEPECILEVEPNSFIPEVSMSTLSSGGTCQRMKLLGRMKILDQGTHHYQYLKD